MNRDRPVQPERLNALSSEELARRSQHGCRASFAELVNRYSVRLFHFLCHRMNNAQDVEDLVQETFIRAFEHISSYRSSYCFSTWLFTIARRLAATHLRSAKRAQPVPEARSAESGPLEAMVRREATQNIWTAARELSANQYQVLWLRYAEEMPIKQVARVMGKSQVGVRVLLHRARAELGEALAEAASAEPPARRTRPDGETVACVKVKGA